MFDKKKQIFTARKDIIVIIIAVIALLFTLLFTPIFNIRNIQVTGNVKVDASTIINMSGLEKGKNIFKTNIINVKEQVSRVAYVDNVKVKIKLPDTVIIEVTEGDAGAYINFAGNFVAINETGKILDVIEQSDGVNKPIVYGVKIDNFEIGKDIIVEDETRKEVLFNLLEQIKMNSLNDDIRYIDINDVTSITFVLKNKTSVKVGDTEGVRYKMAYLRSIIDTFTNEEGGVIDLRDTNNVFYDAS